MGYRFDREVHARLQGCIAQLAEARKGRKAKKGKALLDTVAVKDKRAAILEYAKNETVAKYLEKEGYKVVLTPHVDEFPGGKYGDDLALLLEVSWDDGGAK